MNFENTMLSAQIVMETGEVPLIVGESGIGKTALARKIARDNGWTLVTIDGNLLKEGEIGGLPTVETWQSGGKTKKRTVYAVHTKLQQIDEAIEDHKDVLLFIDEINRCDHAVQQELMNLILNREINGYVLDPKVKIMAAMNPSSKYDEDYDYEVVDMDSAQENRFVWLYMESQTAAWIKWAMENDIEDKIIEFVSTFPEYLCYKEDALRGYHSAAMATPRSFERVSKIYSIYKGNEERIPKVVFLNLIKGNLGSKVSQEFLNFLQHSNNPLVGFYDVFKEGQKTIQKETADKIKNENPSRIYLTGKNILKALQEIAAEESCSEEYINIFIEFLSLCPMDMAMSLMKDMRENYKNIYNTCLNNEKFIDFYFKFYEETCDHE